MVASDPLSMLCSPLLTRVVVTRKKQNKVAHCATFIFCHRGQSANGCRTKRSARDRRAARDGDRLFGRLRPCGRASRAACVLDGESADADRLRGHGSAGGRVARCSARGRRARVLYERANRASSRHGSHSGHSKKCRKARQKNHRAPRNPRPCFRLSMPRPTSARPASLCDNRRLIGRPRGRSHRPRRHPDPGGRFTTDGDTHA
ncbi:hypothetical protein C7405_10137 [Paraburkholderia caballeronis]|nr:hypothetical protein C7405_10137 [Paraburkholderia caballeronis]